MKNAKKNKYSLRGASIQVYEINKQPREGGVGNGTGREYPGVSSWVWLGLGYGLVNLYPSETRTHDA